MSVSQSHDHLRLRADRDALQEGQLIEQEHGWIGFSWFLSLVQSQIRNRLWNIPNGHIGTIWVHSPVMQGYLNNAFP